MCLTCGEKLFDLPQKVGQWSRVGWHNKKPNDDSRNVFVAL